MTFIVAADHPALAGHFPGRPIVPGVLLIAKIVQALHAERRGLRCVGIRHAKFKRAILPGQEIDIEWGGLRDGVLSVSLRYEDVVCAEVRLNVMPYSAAPSPA